MGLMESWMGPGADAIHRRALDADSLTLRQTPMDSPL